MNKVASKQGVARYGRVGESMNAARRWLGFLTGEPWGTVLFSVAINIVAVAHLVSNPPANLLRLVLPLG